MKYTSLDIESIGLHPYRGTIWMLSITEGKKVIVHHDCNGKTDYFKKYKAELEDPDICKIIHNAGFDMPYIELNANGIRIRNVWDTSLCETVIQGTQIPRNSKDEVLKRRHSASLQYTLPRYGFPEPDKRFRGSFIDRQKGIPFTKEDIKYSGDDTKFLGPLQVAQEKLLTRDGGMEVALLENKVVEVVAQMVVLGLGVDEKLWNSIADKNLKQYNKLVSDLPSSIENWNSPAQVKKFFFNRGIHIPTFDDLDLIASQTNDPILNQFVVARSMYSDVTAYGKKWLYDDDGKLTIDADGRVRTSWQQIINTGRFSTSRPNILALPKEGNQRGAIVPAKGKVFVIGDYTGQEIGIMAAASKETLWIDALLRGDDIHGLTASLIFADEWHRGKEKRCVFPQQCNCTVHARLRQQAKVVNFMLAYGGGPKLFAIRTRCDIRTATKIVKRHKRVIPRLSRYLERNGDDAIKTGVSYSADPYRRRIVLQGNEDWQIRNQGKNYPIQSAGANMLKLAMISMPEKYPIVLPFHDELVLEVPLKDAERARKTMADVMNQSADYITGVHGIITVKPRIANNFLKPKK